MALRKTQVNKIPNDRLEAVIQPIIKDLEKRKTKAISESHNNEILNNTILDVINGIELKESSYENIVLDNKIERPLEYGVRIYGKTTGNLLESNTVTDILDFSGAIPLLQKN